MPDARYSTLGDLLRQKREKVIPTKKALVGYLSPSWVVTPKHSAVLIKKIEDGSMWSELEKAIASPSLTCNPFVHKLDPNPAIDKRPQQVADYCRAISLSLEQLRGLLLEVGLPPAIVEHLPLSPVRPYHADRHAPGGMENLYR